MLNHNVIEVSDPKAMWPDQDGFTHYLLHGVRYSPFSENNLEVLDFLGTSLINRKFVRDIHEARNAFRGVTKICEAIDLMKNSTGSSTVHLFDHSSRDYYIMNDPLGGGQIYLFEQGSATFLGSELRSLIKVCISRGYTIEPDPRYFAAEILTYTQSYGSPSPYKNIRVIPRGDFLRIQKNGGIEIFSALPKTQVYSPFKNYFEGFELVKKDLLQNVELSSSKIYDYKISHLTAGFDSRLILSAMFSLGIQDEFLYYCIKDSSDWNLFHRLAGTLNLAICNIDGNKMGKGYHDNYFEFVRTAARASQYTIAEGLDSRWQPANVLVYQGGYGEVARTFNSFAWDGDRTRVSELAYSLWRWNGFPACGEISSSIWSANYVDNVISILASRIDEFLELDLSPDYFTNYLYAEGRNRIFIGARSYYAGAFRAQFDPIYSRYLLATTASLDFEKRKANFLGLDLMNSLYKPLLEYQFDKNWVSELYTKERGAVRSRDFSQIPPRNVEMERFSEDVIPWPSDRSKVSEFDEQVSRRLRIPRVVAFGVRTLSGIALDTIESSDELQSIYNPNGIRALMKRLRALQRDDYLKVHRIISSLILSNAIADDLKDMGGQARELV